MEFFSWSDVVGAHELGALLGLLGLWMMWRGLWGGPHGTYGLARRGAPILERIEGWRLSVLGFAVAGSGLAWMLESKGLLILSLGIGFCEVQEATKVIKAWQYGGVRG